MHHNSIIDNSQIASRNNQILTPAYDTTWWNRTPIRLIQTNLREIDAMMDTHAFVNQ
jgi:hypothetical protein